MSLDDRFAEAMGQLLGPEFPSDLGLAVSGGGDSMAMLTLAHNWTRVWGLRLWVVTVDHGLRPEAADEAALVAETCAELGWPHAVARWRWDGRGNLADAARRARLGLIDRWRGGLAHVAMAHTRDDVAETFLMRLRRGAGLDGLAAMAPRRRIAPPDPVEGAIEGQSPPAEGREPGFTLIRPCLGLRRDALRNHLRVLQSRWAEDPSNEDARFDRARTRRLLAHLSPEGMDVDALAAAAERLAEERHALALRAAGLWEAVGQEHAAGGRRTGILRLDPDWHRAADPATARRLLAAMLRYVSGAGYAPRAEPLAALVERIASGGGGTLHGCEALVRRDGVWLFREAAAAAPPRPAEAGALWDGRWQIEASDPRHSVGILGAAGWRQAAAAGSGALPHRAALSLPALWEGDRLVSCSALGIGAGPDATLCPFGQPGCTLAGLLKSH